MKASTYTYLRSVLLASCAAVACMGTRAHTGSHFSVQPNGAIFSVQKHSAGGNFSVGRDDELRMQVCRWGSGFVAGWKRTFLGDEHSMAYPENTKIVETRDGNLVVMAYTGYATQHAVCISKLTPAGDVLWQRQYYTGDSRA